MNSKNKRKSLIGTFIALMAFTAASATTAGFAWFTTTRTATVHFPNATVKSNRGQLLVGKFGSTTGSRSYEISRPNDEFDATTDSLSSANGVEFYNALLDVDGSELVDGSGNGRYFKVDGDYAQFAFSATTQKDANTDLNVYLERMDIKVNSKGYQDKFDGDGTTAAFVLTALPDEKPIVTVDGLAKSEGEQADFVYNELEKKITFNEGKIPADGQEIVATYLGESHEMPTTDPIYKSLRIAFFAAGHEENVEPNDICLEDNLSVLWDTTHDDGEKHYGITVLPENKAVANIEESHGIRNASSNYVDLDFVPTSITSVKRNSTDLAYTWAAENGRRVIINDEVARGDEITVVYTADKPSKEQYANVADKIDGYYAGKDLDAIASDGDLTDYGAYLGEIKSNVEEGSATPLNIVTRVWIEGTDEDHKVEGERWTPTTEDSIDISTLEYTVSMDLHLAAIDANVA